MPGSDGWKALSEAEQKAIFAEYDKLNKEGLRPGFPPVAPDKATTVRVQNGVVQADDRPYLAESVGAAKVFEAEDMDAAIAMAARIPQARMGGAVEIRPVETYFSR